MAEKGWFKAGVFAAAVRGADDAKLLEMHRWAGTQERQADAPGTGRNSKARRQFRRNREAAEEELARRGLIWT